ncbi:MAG: hypothetical protein JSR78_09440, partial [Proteobacteria bacterium]|nr:hypothetical protein [Pseudomonadota bacterium]
MSTKLALRHHRSHALCIDFPSLVQIMGPGAGTGFSTLISKTLAGIRMRGTSADAWAKAGLVDPHAFGVDRLDQLPAHWDKNLPLDWLKNSDKLAANPWRWMMGDVLPSLDKLGVKGIDADAISKAMAEGKSAGLKAAIDKIDKGSLFSALGKLGYDKTAVQEMMQFINRAPMILRDEALMRAIGNPDDYENYAKALQDVATSFNSAILSFTGKNFVPWVTSQLESLAGALRSLGDAAKGIHSFTDAWAAFDKWASSKIYDKNGEAHPFGIGKSLWHTITGPDAILSNRRFNAHRHGDAIGAWGAHTTPTKEVMRHALAVIAKAE